MLKRFINKLFKTKKSKDTKEGVVKFFNVKKGFGFIAINDSDEEIFVHKTNLKDRIKQNNKVTFEIEEGDRGLTAVNVRLVK